MEAVNRGYISLPKKHMAALSQHYELVSLIIFIYYTTCNMDDDVNWLWAAKIRHVLCKNQCFTKHIFRLEHLLWAFCLILHLCLILYYLSYTLGCFVFKQDHGLIIKDLKSYLSEGYLRAYFREWGTVTKCKVMLRWLFFYCLQLVFFMFIFIFLDHRLTRSKTRTLIL